MNRRVVITGIGTITPCGEGRESLWEAIRSSRTAISRLDEAQFGVLPVSMAGLVRDFDAAKYVTNRKSLKVMCRDIRMAVAASLLARRDAGLENAQLDAERSGVCMGAGLFSHDLEEIAECFRQSVNSEGSFDSKLFGQSGMAQLFPLWLLKYLPNMPACHVSIMHGLRGPSNTITTESASSAAAFEEAYRIIQRGSADLMFCGGAESKINPTGILRYGSSGVLAKENGHSGYAVFTGQSSGLIPGEGGTLMVLEELGHARRRGAQVYAEVGGVFSCVNSDGWINGGEINRSRAYAMAGAMAEAGVRLGEVDSIHLSANGVPREDKAEAAALKDVFEASPEKPFLVATKNMTGYLGFAAAATEIAIAAMALRERARVPSMLIGESLLASSFSFVQPSAKNAEQETVMVNHFATGLSNYSVVLKAYKGKA